MVESGPKRTGRGRLVLAACCATDLDTVRSLGIISATFNGWLALFVGITAIVLQCFPRLMIASVGQCVSEPELKFVFLVLFLFGGLGKTASLVVRTLIAQRYFAPPVPAMSAATPEDAVPAIEEASEIP